MPALVSSTVSAISPDVSADTVGEVRRSLRELIAAGPAAAMGTNAGDRWPSLLGRLVSAEQVLAALEAAGYVDQRRRDLPGEVTLAAVLNCCLYSGEGYDAVLARTFARLPARFPAAAVPTGQALSAARTRLGEAALRELFGQAAAMEPPISAGIPGGYAFGLVVTAIDGTTMALPSIGSCAGQFAVPTGGKNPHARVVTLVTCATRRVRAAAIGSYGTGEQPLADDLVDAFGSGMVNLADRNFFSMARWIRFSATGAHVIWRVKNGTKSVPATIVRRLEDGSCLVRLRESDNMWYRRRRQAGDPSLSRLPDTIARLVEFDLVVTEAGGKRRTTRLRLLTTLLDAAAAPAIDIARTYAERWQVELAYLRLKVTLRGAGVVLRGQTPATARQEIWAFLIVYNALCDLAAHVAALQGIDPDEISFIAIVRATRTHLAADTPCQNCGLRSSDIKQALTALLDDITDHPRNRTGRNRAGPRTAAQRRTGHGTTATYTINIETSNLLKAE